VSEGTRYFRTTADVVRSSGRNARRWTEPVEAEEVVLHGQDVLVRIPTADAAEAPWSVQ